VVDVWKDAGTWRGRYRPGTPDRRPTNKGAKRRATLETVTLVQYESLKRPNLASTVSRSEYAQGYWLWPSKVVEVLCASCSL